MYRSFLSDLVIVLLAFGLSWFFIYDFTSISYFSPLEKSSDFETSDFYQIAEDSKAMRRFCDDVVIVPVDGMSRREIADALALIDYCGPSATGIDILFGYPQPDDSYLIDILADMDNAVVVPDTSSYIYSSCSNLSEGSVYLEAESRRQTVRDYSSEGTLGAELVRHLKPEISLTKLFRIEYAATEFEQIQVDEILDNSELLEGRIVLVGAVEDAADCHLTPIDDAMPGILIHASAIATMLSPDRITMFPEWADWVLAIVLCYVFIVATRWLKRYDWGDFVMRMIQLTFLLLIIFIGSVCYMKYRLCIDFTRPLLMVAAGTLAVDLWNGASGAKQLYRRSRVGLWRARRKRVKKKQSSQI